MRHIPHYLKANMLGLIAIFIALAGTSYAAFSIPRDSVGTRQLRNGAVTPPKLDAKEIGGTIRAWAFVSASGHAYVSHGFGRIFEQRSVPGDYGLELKQRNVARCAPVASVIFDDRVPDSGNGYAVTSSPDVRPPGIGVVTFDSSGNEMSRPFVVELLC
jgi:hypothetical protein